MSLPFGNRSGSVSRSGSVGDGRGESGSGPARSDARESSGVSGGAAVGSGSRVAEESSPREEMAAARATLREGEALLGVGGPEGGRSGGGGGGGGGMGSGGVGSGGEGGMGRDGGFDASGAPVLLTPSSRSGGGRGVVEDRRSASARRSRPQTAGTMRARPLPAHYGARAEVAPLADRMERWKRHKEEESARRRAQEAARELEGCTFRPKINASSRRTAQRQRGGPGPVHERLYRAVTPSRAAQMVKRQRRASAGAGDRVHSLRAEQEERKERGGDGGGGGGGGGERHVEFDFEQRHRPRDPTFKTKEERELEECTFQPKIVSSYGKRTAKPVRSRYMAVAAAKKHGLHSKGSGRARRDAGYEECTFQPKINKVPHSMGAVQAYLSKPAHERLSSHAVSAARRSHRSAAATEADILRAQHPSSSSSSSSSAHAPASSTPASSPGDGSRAVFSMGEFLTAASGGGAGTRGGGEGGEAEEEVERGGGEQGMHERGKGRKKRAFLEFLARQERTLRAKKEFAEEERKRSASAHRPRLCRKSLDMVKPETHGAFLERMQRDAVRKEQSALRERARASQDKDCTFAPEINPVSRILPGRSVADLSRGDALRRETAQRLLKLKLEQEESSVATFHPATTVSQRAPHVDGRLRILEDPDSYIERVQREAAIASERARRAQMEQEEREVAECTFAPEVHEAPEYVKKIAKSMALTRAVRPPSPESKRPEWK